jgi:major membrane immunogen (membrane-anchored lipoprotein)
MTARTSIQLALGLTVAVCLSACGEKAQLLGTKNDAKPYSGAAAAFTEQGWKAVDPISWEQQLRTRAQYGQNDHSRSP